MNRFLKIFGYMMLSSFAPLSSQTVSGVTTGDSLALVGLYNDCDGPHWIVRDNWLSGPVSTWSGVTVENGRVVKLYFNSMGLKGVLPAGLSSLTEIRDLNLMTNQLTGTLPDSWSALVNLKYLYLTNNQISGSIPASWTSLVNLNEFILDANRISYLPDMSAYPSLGYFYVEANWLDFDDIERNLGKINGRFRYCCQANVGVTDTVFLRIGQEFRTSVVVGGSQNRYTWYKDAIEIPLSTSAELVNPGVAFTDAGKYECRITSSVVTGLEIWSNPVLLVVAPPPVAPADSLALVALYNQCDGPHWLWKKNWLTGLVGTWEGVTVEDGRVVGLSLTEWILEWGLTGPLPAEMANLTELRTLELDNNMLTGPLPASWSALTHLETLVLSENLFTGSLPDSWSALVNLQMLYLHYNQLTGSLPESWSSMVKMRDFMLSINQFSGELPASWSSMVNLFQLGLQGSHFTGSLPPEWSSFSKVQWLILKDNELSGPLPESWSSMVSVNKLFLDSNQFTGSLPASWSGLVNLDFLTLGYNQISGAIPESWSTLPKLKEFGIQYNKLNGLPDLTLMPSLAEFYVFGNHLDFGDIEPNLGLFNGGFAYSPQAPVGEPDTLVKNPGQEFRVSVSVGGSSNQYQWYRNDTVITGAIGPEYVIPCVFTGDAGIYTCTIVNALVPSLTLTREPVTLEVSDEFTMVSRKLSAGWTWFSLNLNSADMSVGKVLGNLNLSTGDYIKNQTASATYYGTAGWFGELSHLDPQEMYKIRLSKADTLDLWGTPVDPAASPINIKTGWNWIGYIPQASKPLTGSLSSAVPVANDYIKNQSSSSTFYPGSGWFGGLTSLIPMDAYMFKTSHTGTLVYPVSGSFTDARDGRNYPWIRIGKQTWMQENLAWLPSVSPSSNGSETAPYCYVYDYEGSSVGDAASTGQYTAYGVLYNWEAARTACPSGWHLPADAEWTVLSDFLGASAGGKMKESGNSRWSDPNTGATNSSGFTALPGGYRDGIGGFNYLGSYGSFWTSTAGGTTGAWIRILGYSHDAASRSGFSRSYGISVRCLLGEAPAVLPTVVTTAVSAVNGESGSSGGTITSDGGAMITARGVCWSTSPDPTIAGSKTADGSGFGAFASAVTGLTINTLYYLRAYATSSAGTGYGSLISFTTTFGAHPCAGIPTVVYEGKTYHTVQIGTQCWFRENLNVGVRRDASVSQSDLNGIIDKYCFNNLESNCDTYGGLYQEWEVMQRSTTPGARGICPVGWHVPTIEEWAVLTTALGGEFAAGGKLKETGTAHWQSPNTGATNDSGFTALPGGLIDNGSSFDAGNYGYWWSSSQHPSYGYGGVAMYYSSSNAAITNFSTPYALSVRCLRD